MNLNKTSRLLLLMGTTVLVYALFIMDISYGGRTINLDLLSTRQNLVVLGAVMILVGTILLATSILSVKTNGEVVPDVVQPPRPNPLSALPKLGRRAKELYLKQIQFLGAWRPQFLFRLAWALGLTYLFMWIYGFLPWSLAVLPLLVFGLLAMRKLPSKVAVSKACFWALMLTTPFNVVYLLKGFNDIGIYALLPIARQLAPTLLLIGCFIRLSKA